MQNQTPKEIFLEQLLNNIREFEGTTGAAVHTIYIKRLDTRDAGNVGEESVITQIKLELK